MAAKSRGLGARRQRCVNTGWLLQPGARQTLAVPCGCALWLCQLGLSYLGQPHTEPGDIAQMCSCPTSISCCSSWPLRAGHVHIRATGSVCSHCLSQSWGQAGRLTCGFPPAISVLWAAPQGTRHVTGGESPWLMHVAEAESNKSVAAQT